MPQFLIFMVPFWARFGGIIGVRRQGCGSWLASFA